jgi:hypothetical protein
LEKCSINSAFLTEKRGIRRDAYHSDTYADIIQLFIPSSTQGTDDGKKERERERK